MKKIIMALVCLMTMVAFCFTSCEPINKKHTPQTNVVRTELGAKLYTVEYDSCEYIVSTIFFGDGTGLGITHKGNCKFCEKRK